MVRKHQTRNPTIIRYAAQWIPGSMRRIASE